MAAQTMSITSRYYIYVYTYFYVGAFLLFEPAFSLFQENEKKISRDAKY